MNYKNREQYKHLMRVLAVAAIVLLECAVFSVFWDRYYASHLWLEPFWDKGNQIIVVIYGIFLLVFMYIYGGMKIGYMKGSSIIYSQMMTAFCANAADVSADYPAVAPPAVHSADGRHDTRGLCAGRHCILAF